jgi:sugar O-acyltransferase (sialic acid O-acetyltransferase NeuD family)
MRPLVVVGAGGHAREVLALISRINEVSPSWDVLGLLVDPEFQEGESLDGVPILGGLEWAGNNSLVELVLAIGASAGRAEVAGRLGLIGAESFATLVDPSASVAAGAMIASGSQILAGAVVGAAAQVGRHCILNYGVIVSHECRLDDFVSIGPGACLGGKTALGKGVEVGLGARVLPRMTVDEHAVIGAGAVVTRPVDARSTVAGVPAKVLEDGAGSSAASRSA